MRLNPLHLSCNVSDPFPTAYETFQSSLCVSWAHANISLKPQAQPVYFSRVNFTCQQQLNAFFLFVCFVVMEKYKKHQALKECQEP